jgi:uncharacterized iron-regulated membrane protein
MKGPTRRRLARVHAWAGAILAAPLLLIAASGACLLHRDALFVPRDWRVAEVPATAAADRELVRLLSEEEVRGAVSIQPARGPRGFHVIEDAAGGITYWRVGARAAESRIPLRLRLERSLLELHEHLLLGETGDYLVRAIGPLAASLVALGLFLWWPMRAGWRANDLLPRSIARPRLVRSHLALGAAAGILCFIHASTGAMMANNPAIRSWLKPHADPRAMQVPPTARPFVPHDPYAAFEALREVHVRGEITRLTRAETANQWSMRLRLPGERHPNGRSSITLDLDQGRITAARDARMAGLPGAYDDTAFPLHTGSLFGPFQRTIWTAGALSLVLLALLGTFSFVRHRLSSRNP